MYDSKNTRNLMRDLSIFVYSNKCCVKHRLRNLIIIIHLLRHS